MKTHNKRISESILIVIVGLGLVLSAFLPEATAAVSNVNIQYLGHASFVITGSDKSTVLTDPSSNMANLTGVSPSAMTVSHRHGDHFDWNPIPNGVQSIFGTGNGDTTFLQVNRTVGNFVINNVNSYHFWQSGLSSSSNAVFMFTVDGMKIMHTGDIDGTLAAYENGVTTSEFSGIISKSVDVLLMNVGPGGQEVSVNKIAEFVHRLNPKIIVPMHYWDEATRNTFIDTMYQNYGIESTQITGNAIDISSNSLPTTPVIWVVDPGAYHPVQTFNPVVMPVANPPAGEVAIGTTVTLRSVTDGAGIYYTTDGLNPTSSSTQYKTPITINTPTTIKAYAVKAGMINSAVMTAAYTIQPNVMVDPTSVTAAQNFNQTFTLTLDSSSFLDGINTSNITLGEDFTGLTVYAVTKTAPKTITVVVSGNLQKNSGSGRISVSAAGIDGTSAVTANVITRDMVDECFIATAAYGSKIQPAVVLLRHFRDQFLLTNSYGTAFVQFYYRNSPPIATYIANNEPLKAMVRVLLLPVIAIAYSTLHPGVLGIIAVLILALILYRKRITGRNSTT